MNDSVLVNQVYLIFNRPLFLVDTSELAQLIKENSDKTIWCYTGYRFEDLLSHPRRRALVELCDVIVDGRYIEAERDLSLHFRGSRNQRIIDVSKSLEGTVHLLDNV